MSPDGFEVRRNIHKLLNKLTASQIAELSNLSKSYISQVKHGKRPPSEKLIQALNQFYDKHNRRNGSEIYKTTDLFLKSRRDEISPNTIIFYRKLLSKAIPFSANSTKKIWFYSLKLAKIHKLCKYPSPFLSKFANNFNLNLGLSFSSGNFSYYARASMANNQPQSCLPHSTSF